MELQNIINPVLTPGQRLLSIKGGYEAVEKYPMLQDRLADKTAENVALQNKLDNANQTQNILNNLGRFVAWAGSGTQGAAVAAAG